MNYGYKWLHYKPAKVRLALELYAKGLTLREIASIIGCVINTVWTPNREVHLKPLCLLKNETEKLFFQQQNFRTKP